MNRNHGCIITWMIISQFLSNLDISFPLECGEFTPPNNVLQTRIVNGEIASLGEFPWQVSIQRRVRVRMANANKNSNDTSSASPSSIDSIFEDDEEDDEIFNELYWEKNPMNILIEDLLRGANYSDEQIQDWMGSSSNSSIITVYPPSNSNSPDVIVIDGQLSKGTLYPPLPTFPPDHVFPPPSGHKDSPSHQPKPFPPPSQQFPPPSQPFPPPSKPFPPPSQPFPPPSQPFPPLPPFPSSKLPPPSSTASSSTTTTTTTTTTSTTTTTTTTTPAPPCSTSTITSSSTISFPTSIKYPPLPSSTTLRPFPTISFPPPGKPSFPPFPTGSSRPPISITTPKYWTWSTPSKPTMPPPIPTISRLPTWSPPTSTESPIKIPPIVLPVPTSAPRPPIIIPLPVPRPKPVPSPTPPPLPPHPQPQPHPPPQQPIPKPQPQPPPQQPLPNPSPRPPPQQPLPNPSPRPPPQQPLPNPSPQPPPQQPLPKPSPQPPQPKPQPPPQQPQPQPRPPNQDWRWRWQHFCGGSILNNHWIMTAAHCVESLKSIYTPGMIQIMAGSTNWRTPDSKYAVTIPVDRIIVHEGWRQRTGQNDIALLHLSQPINYVQTDKIYINNICLSKQAELEYDGLCSSSGWGFVSKDNRVTPELMRRVDLIVVDHKTCHQAFSRVIQVTTNQVCAGRTHHGNCMGDSGGPLILKSGNQAIQIGIVSFSIPCAVPGYPDVFTRVSKYIDWISQHTGMNFT